MNTKVFKVSSALKNIIGKELITDDFIAVFELVKNSYDAGATRVDVTFLGLETSSPKLIISDNGRGMTQNDLDNKWLFVAYSSKRQSSVDYRDEIQKRRVYAGSKGIGRFSCDKLGENLQIITKVDDERHAHVLNINWNDFELDASKKIEEVAVLYRSVDGKSVNLDHGTILEISTLREAWDRDKLIKLKRSLEKLINPNQQSESNNFAIYLNVPSEKAADAKLGVEQAWQVVNGHINNFLFESIGLKTIFISVNIPDDGKFIITRLEDRGVLIYEIVEKNPFNYHGKNLTGISVKLFYLNQNAKMHFTKYMGVRPSVFGSVLMYNNGFRVHPFGEWGDDSLGLDTRKAQGFARFLGTRDLIGRIEIESNPDFQEVSSRDGGLISNEAYFCLKNMFIQAALKRLEKYAVDIVKFGNFSEDFTDQYAADAEIGTKILDLIGDLTQSSDIVDVKYDNSIINILSELSEKSLQNIFKNFARIAGEANNEELAQEAKKAAIRLDQLSKARDEAEKEAEIERFARRKAENQARIEAERVREITLLAQKEAKRATHAEGKVIDVQKIVEEKTSQNIFLQSVVNQDINNIISLHHHIGIASGTIENYIKNLTRRIKTGQTLSEGVLLESLSKINEQARKISTTVKFATKANFNLEASIMNVDIVIFVKEYLLNVCDGIIRTYDNKNFMKFNFICNDGDSFFKKIRPLELTIIIDNLVSNSRKAKSTNVDIKVVECDQHKVTLEYIDDGIGIKSDNYDKLFEFGYTSTDGSGLGLQHVKNLLESMNGNITFDPKASLGVKISIGFNK
ncbi:ATP-binding protein [Brucellaceae bacterium C25G]